MKICFTAKTKSLKDEKNLEYELRDSALVKETKEYWIFIDVNDIRYFVPKKSYDKIECSQLKKKSFK